MRGADAVARTLVAAGVKRVFALSGNHVMALFDAALDAKLEIVHVRHEAAAVHMADAWGRLTGEPGVALVTGGPGHANAVGALYTALAAESPMVLLSGHAPLAELGRGAFQELRQADLAAPVAKASWTATSSTVLAGDVARALRTARAGRPGPVHLSLPTDLLEADAPEPAGREAFAAPAATLPEAAADDVLGELAAAVRPVILVGPALLRGAGQAAARRLEAATRVPVVGFESPRGLSDPTVGAFAEALAQADLVVLLGRHLDYTLRYGAAPTIAPGCRFVHVDPEAEAIARSGRAVGERLVLTAIAAAAAAADRLAGRASRRVWPQRGWQDEVAAAIRYRPAEWAAVASPRDGPVHPLEVCRAVQPLLDGGADAALVCDGGEFGQWAQATLCARHRVTNGPAGAIGAAAPFALAARLAFPDAPVVAISGDGSFGFHMAEVDTAARCRAPFVVVVGNDAFWNAERQIQIREYGAARAVNCELAPTRYDRVVAALGGHGEHVERAADLGPALGRAVRSGRPACVNVTIASLPAPRLARAGE
jgi:acetolactate synthase-1/2/3 large subunit